MTANRKYKIILIGPAYPYRGGNSLFVSYLFDSLKDHFDVKIFNYKLLYPSVLFPGKTQYDKSDLVIKETENLRVVNSINPINWIQVASKLRSENADLVVFDWWHPFFGPCHFAISSLIKKKYNRRVLFITENIVSHENNKVDLFLTNLGLRNADYFLALSGKVEKELQRYSKNKKVYRSELPVYDCYNISVEETPKRDFFGFNDNHKVLLFFGYVRKYKGLDILIEAFSKLLKSDLSFRLLIVGEFYDKKDNYIDQIKDFEISEYVKIVDQFVPNEEVYKYYSVSDLVVLPYRSATQSGILNIAYGFLKPVLVTDVGGLTEFVDNRKTGIISPTASPDSIKKGVLEFYSLKESIDFEANILQKTSGNTFKDIVITFNKILGDMNR